MALCWFVALVGLHPHVGASSIQPFLNLQRSPAILVARPPIKIPMRRLGDSAANSAFRKSPITPLVPLGNSPSTGAIAPVLPPLPPPPLVQVTLLPVVDVASAHWLPQESALMDEALTVLLEEANWVIELDKTLNPGKALQQTRSSLLAHLGWSEMPATAHAVPDYALTALQRRFIAEAKHSMFQRLFRAFQTVAMDIRLLLKVGKVYCCGGSGVRTCLRVCLVVWLFVFHSTYM